jgi:hypothetical protein
VHGNLHVFEDRDLQAIEYSLGPAREWARDEAVREHGIRARRSTVLDGVLDGDFLEGRKATKSVKE